MTPDITLVVTVHSETVVCGPTMRSAELAVRAAADQGISVEQVIALDRPTADTESYFAQPGFAHWRHQHLDLGDIGMVRNQLAAAANGRYVAFLDADDLFSENWLRRGYEALEEQAAQGTRAIAHPELNVFFDGMRRVRVNPDQRSPLFTPIGMYFRNYYDTLCLAPREAHLEVPYGGRDIAHGISREDFQFTIETTEAGWLHVTVPDTIIFKRRRDDSLVTESNNNKTIVRSLPAMAIDRVRQLGRRN